MQNQTTATTATTATTKGATITLPTAKPVNKVVNTTAPVKAVKKHKVTKPLTAGKAPVKVAAPIAAPNGVLTLAQTVAKHKGALNKPIVTLFTAHNANGHILANKTTSANLYHAFIAYNGNTNMYAISKLHTCLPAHFYLKGATIGNAASFVNDAKKCKHYACSAFAGIYTSNLKAGNIKALSLLAIQSAATLPTLQAWHKALKIKGAFNAKAFAAFVSKLIA